MNKPFVLFINGINDQGNITVLGVGENNQLKYKDGGSCGVFRFVDSPEYEKQNMIFDTHMHSTVSIRRKPDLIFNEIANADTHRLTLNKVRRTLSQFTCPVINQPDLVLRTSRDQIYELLKDIPGLIAPMTLRCVPKQPQDIVQYITDSELHYPVIVRECGLHNSNCMVLLKDPTDFSELHRFAFDGREFYLIQFIESVQSGIYSKFRIVMVDGKAFFRHARYYNHWNVDSPSGTGFMKENPEYQQKEIQLLENFETDMLPGIHNQIQEIYQKLKLDYFGIDFALQADNHMQIFEVNANMNCLDPRGGDRTREAAIAKIQPAVVQLLLGRMR